MPYGDATSGQKYRRKLDIESLDGNVVEFTMWDEVALQFQKQAIEKLARPIIIVVGSCSVSKYRGDFQLTANSATHYYINPHHPEADTTRIMFKQKYADKPPLQVVNYHYDDMEREKLRNRQSLYTLIQQNPATFKKMSNFVDNVYVCEDHGIQIPPTFRYNVKAIAADGTVVAEFTFFTEAGEKLTRHSCTDVVTRFNKTDKSQWPIELVNTIGDKHIFQIQFSPDTQTRAGQFVVYDLLDVQQQLKIIDTAVASNIHKTVESYVHTVTGHEDEILAAQPPNSPDATNVTDELPISTAPTQLTAESITDPGTPPEDVLETVADIQVVPTSHTETDVTSGSAMDRKTLGAKRSLTKDVSGQSKKQKDE